MKILFQGDSITDANRLREDNTSMGLGYPLLIKSAMGLENPNAYEFVNRGVSGSRIVDIYARIKIDIINIKPDVMSILIGVNDVWHEFSRQNGVDEDKYYKIYSMLIEEIRKQLHNIKIIILEPFVLCGSATEEVYIDFRKEVEKRAKKAKQIAENYDLKYFHLQSIFDDMAKKAPPDYWLSDGVYPTPAGHEIIKNEWIKAFQSL